MIRYCAILLTLVPLLGRGVPAYSSPAEEAERKGEAALKVADFSTAIVEFSEAIRLDPKFALAYCNRGLAYLWNDGDKALADCNEAVRLDPKLALAMSNRGVIYCHFGDYKKAMSDCSEAIRLDPKCAQAYCNRSMVYGVNLELDKSLADCEEAVRLDPSSASALICRGETYFHMAKYDKAIADYSEAIRIDPARLDGYIDRSEVYGQKFECDKALADVAAAVRVAPKAAIVYNHVGMTYDLCAKMMLKSEGKAADSLFDRVAAYFDGPPRKLDDRQQQVPFDGSVEHFRAAARNLDRAHKAQLLFDYSGAGFKTATEIRPRYDFGNNNLGTYYARRGGPEDLVLAAKYFRIAVEANPHYVDAFNNLGIVLALQGRYDEAITAHKAGLALRDSRASDHNNLSRVYLKTGDLDNALSENRAALKCDPKFVGAWLTREQICLNRADLSGSAQCVDRIVALEPTSRDAIYALAAFAGKCLELNRPDDSIAKLDRFLKTQHDAPELYLARGQAYAHKNDVRRAKADFEQALRLRPDFPKAQKELDDMRAKPVTEGGESKDAKDKDSEKAP